LLLLLLLLLVPVVLGVDEAADLVEVGADHRGPGTAGLDLEVDPGAVDRHEGEPGHDEHLVGGDQQADGEGARRGLDGAGE
jgi:hypothetical protein